MARIEPLTDEELELIDSTRDVFSTAKGTIGFVPNSARTILRWPALGSAFQGLAAAMREAVDTLPTGLANLVHLVASQAAGCTYCQAHGAVTTVAHGVSEQKLACVGVRELRAVQRGRKNCFAACPSCCLQPVSGDRCAF